MRGTTLTVVRAGVATALAMGLMSVGCGGSDESKDAADSEVNFAGHAQTLAPGRYRWYVWPGFGARAERRFGRLVGSRSFVVSG